MNFYQIFSVFAETKRILITYFILSQHNNVQAVLKDQFSLVPYFARFKGKIPITGIKIRLVDCLAWEK